MRSVREPGLAPDELRYAVGRELAAGQPRRGPGASLRSTCARFILSLLEGARTVVNEDSATGAASRRVLNDTSAAVAASHRS